MPHRPRHLLLATVLSVLALITQLLSPVVHAAMQARMATDPVLSALCLPDSPEAGARLQRLVQQLPAERQAQLLDEHRTAQQLCQLACGLVSADPAIAAAHTSHPALPTAAAIGGQPIATPWHPLRSIHPPATGPPA